MSTLGRNIAFPIYKGDGTSFHNLVIKKSTSDSIVMSLGDKVTGDVYYKDNTLVCDMDEYIMVDGVKYSIVNPPTIVREGLKSANGDLKGMTKYSFEFYHPMYMLGNMDFSDVAVTNAETMFKSHDRTFSWVGNFTDYVAKLNKNLQGSQFIVSISDSVDADSRNIVSDVLTFTNNTIADAIKRGYDTWHFPFVVDAIKSGEQYYSQGKRFLIQFGNPTREILDANDQPFVFHFGKGVGLKNNSRTPRNNKIVTRVAGYGSEQNIPYGYPQIPWTGDPSATQTADGYPIYDGIVGGVVTKLIKHPFTRTHLMPSVYVESVRKKVNSAASDYDNTTPLVDYYDAPSTYPNPINLDAPKLDIVEIETIKPELGDAFIVGAIPINDDLTPASGWDDTMDDDGNYHQSYFKITLPQLDFDIYACASITEEMKINMRSGACIGCTFDAQVDWDDYKKNFFDAQGNFLPDGEQRDLSKYPKSNNGSIDLIVKKDLNTYGTLMPNVYQYPAQGDKFVILGISLPSTYITNAQERLDSALMAHMLDNNVYYYDYPLNFDEDFFYNHTDILSQVRPNSVLRFTFGDEEKSLYIKQITIKYGEGVLPKYDITLTDNIEVVLNQIGLVADDVSRLALAMMQMNKRTNINVSNTESLQKYVDYTIMPNLESIQKQIDGSQVTYFGNEDPFDASHPYSDGKYVVDPTKFPASEWDDDYSEHDGDMFYNRDTGKGYEFTIIDNLSSPVVYGWQLIQDEDIVQALNNAQTAQDTADGKRRVFICDASHHTPNPPYDVGDLWVNVKYPYSTGATYDDEILKCVVAKTEGQSFSIDDWSLANGYTAALRNFINGTYADDLEDIQNQIDGKAETWYQSTDPSIAWTTPALKNQHKGDIWHNSSNATINGVKAGQDAIWNGTAWVVDETVPQSVYDEIDGKCAIYVTWGAWGNDLQEKDLFIPSVNTTQGGVTYKANKVYRCVDKDTPTFQEIAYTDDTQYNGFITKLIGSSGQTKDAAENAIAAIKHALNEGNTYNEGGLILSNLISLGTGNPISGAFTPWAGISGIYKTSETGTGYKGHGIAAWFGGGMVDGEVSQSATNAAKSLFRFDGSGYVADGNITWDKNGQVTIQGYQIKVGGSNVATESSISTFFANFFDIYNGSTQITYVQYVALQDKSNVSIKAKYGLWTEQYLSALGLNSQGGGGTGDVSHIKIGTNPDVYLDPIDGIIDMSSYAANWNDAYNKRHTHSNKSVLDGITSTKVSHWDAVYGVVPAAAYESGNQLADKNFVNSSIATATATYRGNYNLVSDLSLSVSSYTRAQIASALSSEIVGEDNNDYAFVEIPTSDSTPTQISRVEKYKYNGTAWSYEYTLNNSSFTSDQWNAINSGITPSLVTKLNGIAAGAQVNVIESVKVNGTELSISSKAVDITAVPLTIITGADDLKAIEGLSGTGFLKRTGNNTWALDTTVVLNTRTITAGNGLTGGGDLSENRTINVVSANAAITVNADNIKLNVINDYTTTTNNTIIPLAAARGKDLNDRLAILEAMFTREGAGTAASPYVIKANYGLYTNQFLSSLGQNSQGGSGDFDEEQMWIALGTDVETKVVDSSHIPDIASKYGYATQTWVTNNFNKYTLPLAASGTRGGVQIGFSESNSGTGSTRNYAVKLSSGEKMYVNVPWENTTYSAGTGISISSGTISNNGVRSITKHSTTAYDILLINTGGTIDYLDLSHQHSYWEILDKPTDLEGFGLTDELNALYVTALGTSGNYLTWTKNGSTSNITIPYATLANTATTAADTSNTLYLVGVTSEATTTLKRDTSISVKGSALNAGSVTTTGDVSVGGTLGVTGATTLTGLLTANGNIKTGTDNGAYIQIGAIKLVYDSTNNALKVIKSDNTSANLYATGAVSALGANSSGGGGDFDEEQMWEALGTNTTTKVIATSHIPDMAGIYGYLKQSSLSGYVTSVKVGTTAYNPSSGVVSLPAYPTTLPASDVYAWAKASTKPSYTLDEVSDGSTRKLANYLPLSGGALTGKTTVTSSLFWGDAPFVSYNTKDGSWITSGNFLAPNLTAQHYNAIMVGVKGDTNNSAHFSFYYAGNNSTDNRAAIAFYNNTDILVVKADGNVGIKTNAPTERLHVNGYAYASSGFKKGSSSDSYVLLGGGGHKAVSDFALYTDNVYMKRDSDTFLGTHTYTGSSHIFETTGSGTITIFKHTGSGTPVPFKVSESSSQTANNTHYGVLQIERLNTDNGWNDAGASLYFCLKNTNGASAEVAGISGINTQNGKLIFCGRNRSEIGSIDSVGLIVSGNINSTYYGIGQNVGGYGTRSILRLNSPSNIPVDIVLRSGTFASGSYYGDWTISSRGNEASDNNFYIFRGEQNTGNASQNSLFRIDSANGYVTIGQRVYSASAATEQLDIRGNVRANGFWAGTGHIAGRAGIRINSTGTSYPTDILLGHTNDYSGWTNVYWALSARGSGEDYRFSIWRGSALTSENELFVLTKDLNVGIGTTSPSYKLHVNGTFYASGNSSIGGTLGVTGAMTIGGNINMSNNKSIYSLDSENTNRELFGLTSYNNLSIGSGVVGAGGGTYIMGNSFVVRIGDTSSTGNALAINSSKDATLAGTLRVNGNKIYFGDTSHYVELNSTGFHFSHGVYSDSFMSALGANSGGGSGDFSEEQMWDALQSNTGTYANEKIDENHIPDTSSIYGYLKSSSLSGYATQSWVNTQLGNYLPLSGGTLTNTSFPLTINRDAASSTAYIRFKVQGTTVGYLGVDSSSKPHFYSINSDYYLLYSGNYTDYTYSSTASRTANTVLAAPNGSAGAATFRSLVASDIPDLSSTYATASRVTTLEGYFTSGSAKTALALKNSRTLWGQSFNGTDNVSGNMTDVGTINASGNITVTKATTASTFVTVTNSNGSASLATGTYRGLYDNTTTQWIIGTNGTNTWMPQEGNVGIGTTSPSYKLDVNGTFNASGNASVGGNISVSGTATIGSHVYMGYGKILYMQNSSSTNQEILTINTNDNLRIGYGIRSGAASTLLYSGSGGVIFRTDGTNTATASIDASGNFTAAGEITASSDARKKNIVSNTKFNVRDIASARSVLYEWNDGRDKNNEKRVHGGSIAQDWLGKADSFLNQDSDGFYSINYGALALCSAITIAREVVKHEDRITMLEKENAKLKARIAELEERRAA